MDLDEEFVRCEHCTSILDRTGRAMAPAYKVVRIEGGEASMFPGRRRAAQTS